MTERYGIKEGYRPRSAAHTHDSDGDAPYWTDARLEASASFQFYVYRLARRLIRLSGYTSFLDVGSGPGTKVERMIRPICSDLVLVDQPSSRALVEARLPTARFVEANLETIDLDLGRRFDLILCSDVLEHLLDPDPCVSFVRRHLAPGGVAVFSTPDRDHLRGPACTESPHPEHVREWSGPEFAAFLESRGYRVERQYWYPLERIGAAEYAWSRLRPNAKPDRWAACQAAVCRTTDSLG